MTIAKVDGDRNVSTSEADLGTVLNNRSPHRLGEGGKHLLDGGMEKKSDKIKLEKGCTNWKDGKRKETPWPAGGKEKNVSCYLGGHDGATIVGVAFKNPGRGQFRFKYLSNLKERGDSRKRGFGGESSNISPGERELTCVHGRHEAGNNGGESSYRTPAIVRKRE